MKVFSCLNLMLESGFHHIRCHKDGILAVCTTIGFIPTFDNELLKAAGRDIIKQNIEQIVNRTLSRVFSCSSLFLMKRK